MTDCALRWVQVKEMKEVRDTRKDTEEKKQHVNKSSSIFSVCFQSK